MKDDYWDKTFSTSVSNGCDNIRVEKIGNSDWSHIKMITNNNSNGEITIRSKEQVEQIHFLLGQMLGI